MKPSSLIPLIVSALKNGWALLLQGQPGAGKSDIIESAAKSLGYDLLVCHPVVDDPTDAKGLPGIVNGKAEFLPYGNLRAMQDAVRPLVVFIDDARHAPQAVQAAYMQLLLARTINGKRISDHVRFIAATNRQIDGAGGSNLITPFVNRFHAVLDIDIDAGDWQKWAIANGIALEVIAFIGLRPAMLTTFDPKAAKEGKPFASPRSVARLSDWVKANAPREVFAGCVGESFATEFSAFLDIYRRVGQLPARVVLNPTGTEVPSELDIRFALMAALTYHANPVNIDAIGQYVDRVDPEFSAFFWKIATGRKPELTETHAFNSWAIKNADQIN